MPSDWHQLFGKSIADSAVQVYTSHVLDNAQIASSPNDGKIFKKMGDFRSEVVGEDFESCSADWDQDNGLEIARKDAAPYWQSDTHETSIFDVVQIDNVQFKMMGKVI